LSSKRQNLYVWQSRNFEIDDFFFRKIEDYAVVYFGAALFKILRLLSVGTFSVHMFACVFFRVKIASATNPDDVADFYESKNVENEVENRLWIKCSIRTDIGVFVLQNLMQQYVSRQVSFSHLHVPSVDCTN
jgi:hypothetical protein